LFSQEVFREVKTNKQTNKTKRNKTTDLKNPDFQTFISRREKGIIYLPILISFQQSFSIGHQLTLLPDGITRSFGAS
jgi:hypothetical protein